MAALNTGLHEGFLHDLLMATTEGRGVASVSVVEKVGAEPRTAWVPHSIDEPAFLAYSITKTFTAALVLKLAEAGVLRLDDGVSTWLPGVPSAEYITLRQLLNHTAGIPDYGGLRAYHDGVRSTPSIPWSAARFDAEAFGKGLLFEPGRGWAYSNIGYMLVNRVVAEVTGTPYRTLVLEHIVRPLGLDRTFVPESIDDLASLAPGVSCVLAADGAPQDVRAFYHPGWVSHGVIASTASDIVRFLDRLFTGHLLSRASLDEMLQLVPVPGASPSAAAASVPPLRPGRPSYGLGLMGDPASPWGLIAGHNGGGPCYSASAFHVFGAGVSVCAMGAIEDDFSAERIVAATFDRLLGETPA